MLEQEVQLDVSGDSRRVFEDVCEQVRADLARGLLKPGDRLPAEREMAERFGIGRNAVREALRALENAGIVRLQKGRNGGAYIRSPNTNRVTGAIKDLIDYGSLGWKDLTEARFHVMEVVVGLACERATTDLALLERNLDLTEEAKRQGQRQLTIEHAYDFYRLLAEGTHNSVLVLLVTVMSDLLRKFVQTAAEIEELGPLPSLVPARRKMLVHLRAGSAPEAAAELNKQLRQVHLRIDERIARGEAMTRTGTLPESPVATSGGTRSRAK
jgi:GntR family transcriptional repressor for pyruvate dehydrogenase complex